VPEPADGDLSGDGDGRPHPAAYPVAGRPAARIRGLARRRCSSARPPARHRASPSCVVQRADAGSASVSVAARERSITVWPIGSSRDTFSRQTNKSGPHLLAAGKPGGTRIRPVLTMWTASDTPILLPCHAPAADSPGCWLPGELGARWPPAGQPISICSSRSRCPAGPPPRWSRRRLSAPGARSGVNAGVRVADTGPWIMGRLQRTRACGARSSGLAAPSAISGPRT
jgi:hypothetical protein